MVEECPLELFQTGTAVVEDVCEGAEHDVVAADSSVECGVDEGAQRLDVKPEIVDLTRHIVHRRFCVKSNPSKPLTRTGLCFTPTLDGLEPATQSSAISGAQEAPSEAGKPHQQDHAQSNHASTTSRDRFDGC